MYRIDNELAPFVTPEPWKTHCSIDDADRLDQRQERKGAEYTAWCRVLTYQTANN